MINDVASKMALQNKDGSGNCVSMNAATEIIPRKTTGNGKHRDKYSIPASSVTHDRDPEDK